MRLLQFALDSLTRRRLVCLAFKRIIQGGAVLPRLFTIQSRRFAKGCLLCCMLVCYAIGRPAPFIRHCLGLFALQSTEVCSHSTGRPCKRDRIAASTAGASQRTCRQTVRSFPAILPPVWFSLWACTPYQGHVCSAFTGHFKRFSCVSRRLAAINVGLLCLHE